MEKINRINIMNSNLRRYIRIFTTLSGAIGLGLIIGVLCSVNSLHMNLLQFTVLLCMMFISLYLSIFRQNQLLPFIVLTWALSPEVRRIIDWLFRTYSEVSIISILPHCISLTLLIPIIKNIGLINKRVKVISIIMGVTLAYGFIIGFPRYGMSSLFELLNYAVPFLIFIYINVCNLDNDVRNRWLRSISFIGVLVSVYGIYQYLILPEWDQFWMLNAGMKSIGAPEPQNFRLFSTINSPGPTGAFLGIALAIMTVNAKWRAFGLIGMMLVGFALLLTLVRSGWIAYIVIILAYLFRSQLKNKMMLLAVLAVIGLAYQFLLPILPGASSITSRVSTLSSLEEDHSFNERISFASNILSSIKENPIGRGLGSTGISSKISNNSGVVTSFDNGFLNIFYTFGLPLGLALIATLCYLAVYFFKLSRIEKEYSSLSFAISVAILFLLTGSNIIPGIAGVLLWLIIGLTFISTTKHGETELRRAH